MRHHDYCCRRSRRHGRHLGSGIALGIAGGIASAKSALVGAIELSTSTFGGFVNLNTSLWFGAGSVFSSAFDTFAARKSGHGDKELPQDMSATSLFGGGLIAGDALAALGIGTVGLLATVAG